MADRLADNSKKTAKKPRGKPFEKGTSGNPGGRPKHTEEQKDALQAIRDLAPAAVEELKKMIEGMDTPPAQRVKAIEMVLERTYGKAEARVEVSTPDSSVMDEIRKRMKGDAI